jgi:hypothetical protein
MEPRGGRNSRWRARSVTAPVLVLSLFLAGPLPAGIPVAGAAPASAHVSSEASAYLFLDQMMDRYATGSAVRLVQSFTGGTLEKLHFTDSITYDDAVVIDALLARGTAADVARAGTIGDALLYVQANDTARDGRVRAAYAPDPLTGPGSITVTDPTSDVGNVAWVGQALLQLYARTGQASDLAGATAAATWIYTNTYDTRGAGGYTGGLPARGAKIEWKSTEHNIDVYALFSMLAAASGNPVWTARAEWAEQFIVSMWNAASGRFAVGTLDDGVSVNTGEQPEDVNTWSYLALEDPAYASSIDWDVRNLAVSKRGFNGVSFCQGDRSGVWFEGTAHLADALELRGGSGDRTVAGTYLGDVAHAQIAGLHTDGSGIIAASKNRLSDCDGDHYFASLHSGATAWYLLALQATDPFHVIPPPPGSSAHRSVGPRR